MGSRVDLFNDAHPDTDQGNTLSAGQLKMVVGKMKTVAATQRAGLVSKATSTDEKAQLRHDMLSGPIAHLWQVGKRARRAAPELALTFRYKPGKSTYVAFATAARGMLDAAAGNKEVLMQHGLSEAVVARFAVMLDQFDAAVRLGDEGRIRHKGATKQLDDLAAEVRSIVRTMDARNRLRFQDDRELLESWISATSVLGQRRSESDPADGGAPDQAGPATPGSGGPSASGGEERPAA